ncbi:probable 2-oxoglutarate-dependent dioxygenase AOP1 [Pyrus communis]|uniref:probable 2-oxoglutarate-dependent dioxygenase AOP1 n=1 Tax=Pyrus communis TaxID=23211 RepID=UPI0035BFEEDE
MAKLAVVDLSNEDCFKPGTSSWLSVRKDICHALEDLGCFVAILPDKISSELRSAHFGMLDELFDFPTETKMKSSYEKPYPTGYQRVEGAAYESLGIAGATNPEQTQIFEHHFWPNGNDVFHETADLYIKVMEELHHAVTRMVFEKYGVEEYLDDHLQSTIHTCRFSKYSEPAEKTGTDMSILRGIHGHTDTNFTTILYQNDVKGLEIKSKDDEWIGFDPLPSSFIFLAGDGVQVWSNDRIRACRHRVTWSENDVRYSGGLFSFRVGETHTPKELIDEDHPLQYKPLNTSVYTEYRKKNYASIGPDYTVKAYCGV